ncbi:MAG: serine--tRNA ligase [Deferribacteraceae bacterium]|nr:serine--tRNA ligase [Deferribacteraceae bacterium]
MLDIKQIITDADYVRERLLTRGADIPLEKIIKAAARRKQLIAESDELKRKRNELSRLIGRLKNEGKDALDLQSFLSEDSRALREVKESAVRMERLDKELKELEVELEQLLLVIPNLPDASVPIGKDERDNPVYRIHGDKPVFSFQPKAHWDLAGDSLDFERGAKISGARFTILKAAGARLERALINFMMDLHAQNGYTEVIPPLMIKADALQATGQLPKFQEELFWCERDGLYLSPTAEVPVTNMFAGEVLTNLPLSYTAYSACFRREAGSYGKDVRGLIRQHQFNKVELVKFSTPEESMNELEKMLDSASLALDQLGLHYRVVVLCTGDMGFAAAKTYDIEVWMPAQGVYREISSCSNCKDFQARRANIRYRGGDGKLAYVHTLNGSGLAVGRTMAAIIENCQNEDGSINIPTALRQYMRTDKMQL